MTSHLSSPTSRVGAVWLSFASGSRQSEQLFVANSSAGALLGKSVGFLNLPHFTGDPNPETVEPPYRDEVLGMFRKARAIQSTPFR